MENEPRDRFAINVVENSAGEILLLKRREDKKMGPGRWGLPAGHIEEGETPEQCAWRELREEIGDDFRTELVQRYGPVRDTWYGGIYAVHLFHHRWLDGTVQMNEEHTDYAWVSRESYHDYAVMDGIDEDLYYLGIWPVEYLNKDKLPIATESTEGKEVNSK